MASLFVHEDDWGMISLVLAENRADRTAVVEAARTHGDSHRAPDGVGWTAMYVAPSPPAEIDVRKITLDALGAVLGSSWQPVATLTSGYSGSREAVGTGYAFQLPRPSPSTCLQFRPSSSLSAALPAAHPARRER